MQEIFAKPVSEHQVKILSQHKILFYIYLIVKSNILTRTLFVICYIVSLLSYSGCYKCGGPGTTGVDCSKYSIVDRLQYVVDLDSNANGFKLSECDTIFIIAYEKNSNYLKPIDSIIQIISLYNIDNMRKDLKITNEMSVSFHYPEDYFQNRSSQFSFLYDYLILNKKTNNKISISEVTIIEQKNNSDCCKDYVAYKISSYKLNGTIINGNSLIYFKKK